MNTLIDTAKIELARKIKFDNRLDLVNEVLDGIKRVAGKHAKNNEQRKDFIQDGIVCALEIFDRYRDIPKDELIFLAGKAIYRRICYKQRSNITFDHKHWLCSDYDEKIQAPENEDEYNYEHLNLVKILMTKLSAIDKQILQERVQPSDKTVCIMLEDEHKKLKRKEFGHLVMNIGKERITIEHIAKSIGISKATVSRGIKRIQEKAKSLIEE